MFEFVLNLALVLAVFFWLLAIVTQRWVLMATAAMFFLFIAIGLLSTGLQRYEGHNRIVDMNNSTTDVIPLRVNHNATLEANPTLYGFAMISLILALALTVSSVQTWRLKRLANVSSDEDEEFS